jgi:hypothetical protein
MGVKHGTLGEEYKLRVFEVKVLIIFQPKRDEGIGDRKKLYDVELNSLYSSPRRIRWAWNVA